MPRGYTEISFIGGLLDGEVTDFSLSRKLPNVITRQTETFFSHSDDNGVSIMKGKLSKKWFAYALERYEKSNDPSKSGVSFVFSESVTIRRCCAITKLNERCMKASLENKDYCNINHKASADENADEFNKIWLE